MAAPFTSRYESAKKATRNFFSTKILAITNGGKARQRFEFKLKFGRRQIIGHAEE